jgi:hypothetical protein
MKCCTILKCGVNKGNSCKYTGKYVRNNKYYCGVHIKMIKYNQNITDVINKYCMTNIFNYLDIFDIGNVIKLSKTSIINVNYWLQIKRVIPFKFKDSKRQIALCKKCPNILKLNLSNLFQLTNNGLKSILYNCPNIQNLDISNCSDLTEKCIRIICKKCKFLKELNIKHDKYSYRQYIINYINKKCPNIILIH